MTLGSSEDVDRRILGSSEDVDRRPLHGQLPSPRERQAAWREASKEQYDQQRRSRTLHGAADVMAGNERAQYWAERSLLRESGIKHDAHQKEKYYDTWKQSNAGRETIAKWEEEAKDKNIDEGKYVEKKYEELIMDTVKQKSSIFKERARRSNLNEEDYIKKIYGSDKEKE